MRVPAFWASFIFLERLVNLHHLKCHRHFRVNFPLFESRRFPLNSRSILSRANFL